MFFLRIRSLFMVVFYPILCTPYIFRPILTTGALLSQVYVADG